uniref:Uncharacterized protein n=1 Tax=Aureoumbra lagunensis TaxID=44058 RepID=A0A7S3JXX0_9STRA|mmetsp:Transcript_19932/g.24157  ORF Transcript_19932/g.24157 Transcript_19932/m.24157 type:complete len:114 (+) Transcript_19932:46-387(+)
MSMRKKEVLQCASCDCFVNTNELVYDAENFFLCANCAQMNMEMIHLEKKKTLSQRKLKGIQTYWPIALSSSSDSHLDETKKNDSRLVPFFTNNNNQIQKLCNRVPGWSPNGAL